MKKFLIWIKTSSHSLKQQLLVALKRSFFLDKKGLVNSEEKPQQLLGLFDFTEWPKTFIYPIVITKQNKIAFKPLY